MKEVIIVGASVAACGVTIVLISPLLLAGWFLRGTKTRLLMMTARPRVTPEDDWTGYFDHPRFTEDPVLEYRKSPCHDCAVTCGFYLDISKALKLQPKEVQIKVSERWFCHNDALKACRGNLNYLGLI